jgi:hypothetical protein
MGGLPFSGLKNSQLYKKTVGGTGGFSNFNASDGKSC